ncbi:hypothetical protein [Candidatus Chloroploca sp. Khr17]|uniref:hypothetical protein n=1 Tax=Candidatus Chloroploca sp. Khr17 TaxID=2496869 RepID=UPI00101C36E9|nr:hypothetical protein [Candidatus Chloroploca sp. Khr17]
MVRFMDQGRPQGALGGWWLVLLGSLLLGLTGCAVPPTYADRRATAQVTGCWPDQAPTPPPVTVTPDHEPLEAGAPDPFATALPTTTPYPRCDPGPGATLPPWPTPIPAPPPYPTMEARRWRHGSERQTTLQLPGMILDLDLATHPTEGWPVLGAAVWSPNEDPDRIFVMVQHPQTQVWSPARQVDLGAAQVGRFSRTVAVAIAPDHTLHAVWGMSDPHPASGTPAGIWASQSHDYGATWQAPERLATGCRRVNDLAVGADGRLVAMLICEDGPDTMQLAMVTRLPAEGWQPVTRLPVPTWYFSEGRLVILGAGEATHVLGVVLTGGAQVTAVLVHQHGAPDAPWQLAHQPVAVPGIAASLRMWRVQALVAPRPAAPDRPLIMFTWTDAEHPATAYALTSLDGGAHWLPLEAIVHRPGATVGTVIPGYDPVADQVAALWTCCDQMATHYAAVTTPGTGAWQTLMEPLSAAPLPLALGSRAVGLAVGAQALQSRTLWLAWVEQQQRVTVRTLELNQILSAQTLAPAATPSGGRP